MVKSRWINGYPKSIHKQNQKKIRRSIRASNSPNTAPTKQLSDGFKENMFKASHYTPKNMGGINEKDLRIEYRKMSKIANKRINDIVKSGYYSYTLENLKLNGFGGKFGVKNQGLKTTQQIKDAYRQMLKFLNSDTSSKSGIRDIIDKTNANFGLTFDGNYATASQRNKKLFELYNDLQQLSENGLLNSKSKYEIINELGKMYDMGILDNGMSVMDIIDYLNGQLENRHADINALYQQKLNFNWDI